MAYVAISQRLREDVSMQIQAKRNKELSLIQRPSAPVMQHDDPRFIAYFWGEYEHLRTVIPTAWCKRAEYLTLATDFEQIPGDPSTLRTITVTPSIQGGLIYAPPNADAYHARLYVSPDAPEVADFVRAAQDEYAINARWRKVNADVMSFLTNCKSLNEALKLWPDVRIYIPQSYIDKAEEKTVKAKAAESKAVEILKQIDTDHAVSSAVMVRILEANKQHEVQS